MKLFTSSSRSLYQMTALGVGLSLSGASVFATGTTYSVQSGANGTTWDTTTSWTKSGGTSTEAFPNGAGDTATNGLGSGAVTMTLNGTVTVGRILKPSGGSSDWTINAGTGALLILDNTGGTGATAEIITGSGSSSIHVNPDIQISNTDLRLGTTNARHVNIGGGVIAEAAQTRTLTFFNNGAGAVNIRGSVGASGGSINIVHTGTGAGTATLTDTSSLGANVLSITQNSGTSKLTVSGDTSAFAGDVIVTAGTLDFAAANSGAGFAVSHGSLSGTGIVAGAVAVTGGTLAAGTEGTAGTLTFSSTLNLAGLTGAGQLKFDLGAVGASDKIVLSSGALSLGGGLLDFSDFSFTALEGFGAGTYTLFDTGTSIGGTLGSNLSGTINGYDAVLSILGNDLILTVAAIPEPSACALVLGGLAVAFAALRRRR